MTAPDILSALDAVEHQGASERIRKYLLGYLQFYIVALADNAEAVLKLLLPCGKKLFLMEAQVAQFIAFLAQQVRVVIYLRGVDLVVQLHLACTAGLHLVLAGLALARKVCVQTAGDGKVSRVL